MTHDEQRRPATPQHAGIYADLGTIVQAAERATNLLHDADIRAAEAAAERDRLEAALRGLLDTLDEYRGDLSMGPTDTWRAARAALGDG